MTLFSPVNTLTFLSSSPVFPQIVVGGDSFSKHVPTCLLLRLREVVLRNFFGTEDELSELEYLLQSARVLEKVTIGCYMSAEEDSLCILERLLSYPRVSRACRIIVV